MASTPMEQDCEGRRPELEAQITQLVNKRDFAGAAALQAEMKRETPLAARGLAVVTNICNTRMEDNEGKMKQEHGAASKK